MVDLDEMLQKYRQHDSIDTSFIGKVIGAGVNVIGIGCMTAEGSDSQGLKGKQVRGLCDLVTVRRECGHRERLPLM